MMVWNRAHVKSSNYAAKLKAFEVLKANKKAVFSAFLKEARFVLFYEENVMLRVDSKLDNKKSSPSQPKFSLPYIKRNDLETALAVYFKLGVAPQSAILVDLLPHLNVYAKEWLPVFSYCLTQTDLSPVKADYNPSGRTNNFSRRGLTSQRSKREGKAGETIVADGKLKDFCGFLVGGANFVPVDTTPQLPWNQDELSLIAKANAMQNWKQENRFCAGCGRPMIYNTFFGTSAYCSQCNEELKPQNGTVSYLVTNESGSKCFLLRSSSKESEVFQTFTGFIELGETAEMAVWRLLALHFGVDVHEIAYSGISVCQPQRGNLYGCIATLSDEDIAQMNSAKQRQSFPASGEAVWVGKGPLLAFVNELNGQHASRAEPEDAQRQLSKTLLEHFLFDVCHEAKTKNSSRPLSIPKEASVVCAAADTGKRYVDKIRALYDLTFRPSFDRLVQEYWDGMFLLTLDSCALLRQIGTASSPQRRSFGLALLNREALQQTSAVLGFAFEPERALLLDVISATDSGPQRANTVAGSEFNAVFSYALDASDFGLDATAIASREKYYASFVQSIAKRFDAAGLFEVINRASRTILDDFSISLLNKASMLTKAKAKLSFCRVCSWRMERPLFLPVAVCPQCKRIQSLFYSLTNEQITCLVSNNEATHCLLSRKEGVSEFATLTDLAYVGETPEQAAKRIVAESIGIEAEDVFYSGINCQSLSRHGRMVMGFVAVASNFLAPKPQVGLVNDARWFSRQEVANAYDRQNLSLLSRQDESLLSRECGPIVSLHDTDPLRTRHNNDLVLPRRNDTVGSELVRKWLDTNPNRFIFRPKW